MDILVIPTKGFRHNGVRHLPGDKFSASEQDANILLAEKKVRLEDGGRVVLSPPPPPVAAAIGPASQKERLRAEAETLGIQVVQRWGAARIQREIDRAKASPK
jgi:hypothetical protein